MMTPISPCRNGGMPESINSPHPPNTCSACCISPRINPHPLKLQLHPFHHSPPASPHPLKAQFNPHLRTLPHPSKMHHPSRPPSPSKLAKAPSTSSGKTPSIL